MAVTEVIILRNLLCFFVTVLILCNWESCLGGDLDVYTQVTAIKRSVSASGKINFGQTEKRLLDLLRGISSSQERGFVFMTIARIGSADMENQSEKVIYYAREAIGNEIGVLHACDMYLCLGQAVEVQARQNCTNPKGIAETEKQLQPYVQGLAFVLGHLRIDKQLPLPSVGKYDVDEQDPEYKTVVRQHEKEMAYRDYVVQQNRLLMFGDGFARRILSLYPLSEANSVAFGRVVRDAVSDTRMVEQVIRYCRDRAKEENTP